MYILSGITGTDEKVSSNKFWGIKKEQQGNSWVVTIVWGRIGTKGGSKSTTFPTQYSADNEIEKRTSGKRREGYKKVKDEEFRLETARASIIGSNRRLHDIQWVHVTNSGGIEVKAITSTQLDDPKTNPGITVVLDLPKKQGEQDSYKFLFASDGDFIYEGRKWVDAAATIKAAGPEFAKLVGQVRDAIFPTVPA